VPKVTNSPVYKGFRRVDAGYLARPERFELPTNWFEASYSIQLSYGRVEEGGLYRFLAEEEGLTANIAEYP
tara:strand:+ start:501 stop:713 length:213 start_codon:yes stop_codon:yes gene_type:complete